MNQPKSSQERVKGTSGSSPGPRGSPGQRPGNGEMNQSAKTPSGSSPGQRVCGKVQVAVAVAQDRGCGKVPVAAAQDKGCGKEPVAPWHTCLRRSNCVLQTLHLEPKYREMIDLMARHSCSMWLNSRDLP